MADPTQTFWRYRDAVGRDVVVNDMREIPPALRASATVFDPSPPPPPTHVRHEAAPTIPETVGPVHVPSAVLGLVTGALLVAVLSVRRRTQPVVTVAVAVASLALIGALYFGWVMRTVGLGSGGVVASPTEALDEARRAAAAANQAASAQEAALEKIEKAEKTDKVDAR